MQSQNMISALDLASRSANMELEFEASIARLEAMCETLCASTRDRLTRRVNRIPATLRATPIIDILAPSPATAPSTAVASAPAVSSSSATHSASVSRTKPTTKPIAKKALNASRKANPAPTAAKAKPAPKPVTKTSTSPPPSRHTAMRSKKRTSEDISSENKENSPVVNNKRARTNAVTKTATKTKAAPTTRATRAASRQQSAQILSPKNDNVRQKGTKTNTRPR
ncbi:hypothetical protein HBI56_211830 [Parastagonospora nodorum]|nr:hypothetical protein HBI09_192900 [Parastagonospora nodorum]KAH4159173.1 hypothetical protein HBH43_188100 [Parastagonospora nodorum]KAH4236611.1 hypothetical protein HBI06_047310 [Parastagonospora nodorum]KAH4248317.1 hypothetical protein HBI05_017650 [Parastagonospora nodorum]KAH4286675.1 hypothetical protein HBI02_222810 [Parastagonospora nodorum]